MYGTPVSSVHPPDNVIQPTPAQAETDRLATAQDELESQLKNARDRRYGRV